MTSGPNQLSNRGSFNVIGVVLISTEGPSFGTPIFSDGDGDNYIQSSATEITIDEFVRIPRVLISKANFFPLRLNVAVPAGYPFLFGFRDMHDSLFLYEKSALKEKLLVEFEYYDDLPFLSFAIARFLGDPQLIERVIALPAVGAALKSGELETPDSFSDHRSPSQANAKSPQLPVGRQAGQLRATFESDDNDRSSLQVIWTDERVELLKKLWADGLNATQIAKRLGGDITKNGVIGKVHRLGLSTLPPLGLGASLTRTDEYGGKTLLELSESVCRWPIAGAQADGLLFCGRPVVPGLPYCKEHAEQAYNPKANSDYLNIQNRPHKIGEIVRKHGNTLIRTLRKTYGSDFAAGYADTDQLGHVLHKLDESSLSKLVIDHQSGKLKQICLA